MKLVASTAFLLFFSIILVLGSCKKSKITENMEDPPNNDLPEMYLKRITETYYDSSKIQMDYYYSDGWVIDSIITKNNYGNVFNKSLYRNDTLILQTGYLTKFIYYKDSILSFSTFNDVLTAVYYIDPTEKVYREDRFSSQGFLIESVSSNWNYGNCINTVSELNGTSTTTIYNTNVNNPFYNENKHFRNIFLGSINYIKKFTGARTVSYVINEIVNSYPESVTIVDNDIFVKEIEFEYYMLEK